MIVKNEVWQGVPLLHIMKEEMESDAPVTFFFHGFSSAKEHNLHYAYNLVQKGVRVILPDAHLHGERTQNLDSKQMDFEFWNIVLKSVAELEVLYKELAVRGFSPSKIAVAGTSMGGIVTSGSLCQYDWIDTAAICMGVSSYSKFATYQIGALKEAGGNWPLTQEQEAGMIHMLSQYDLEAQPEILAQKPIIFWHGEKDATVPFFLSHNFFIQQQQNEVVVSEYIADKKAGHAVSRDGILAVTKWLAHHLA